MHNDSVILTDTQKACADNFVSLVRYEEKKYLIVLNCLGLEELEALAPLLKRWNRTHCARPLLLTPHDIVTSCDIFPIEFLNIKETGTLIGGQDLFGSLEIPRGFLRTQCEHDLKGKLIVLRQGYVEHPEQALSLIQQSLPAFVLVFQNILRLTGEKLMPGSRAEIIARFSDMAGIKRDTIPHIVRAADGEIKLTGRALKDAFRDYLTALHQAANYVDQFHA